MKLSLRPQAAPAYFPYPQHRNLSEVWAEEQIVATAVHNFVREATKAADSVTESSGRESASTLNPGPDQLASKERTAMTLDTARSASAQANRRPA